MDQTIDFHFPKAGVHQAGPYGRQPVRQGVGGVYVKTAADGYNVRSYDPVSGRDRGGSRSGLSKFVAGRVPGEQWVVQDIRPLVTTNGSVPAVQQNASGRVVYLVAVSQGLVKVAVAGDTSWTATTNNTGLNPPLNYTGVMQSTAVNQLLFFADGTNYAYYKPPTNSVELWTPTAGSLPRDTRNNGCRLLTTWRGRAVMSGLVYDPHNWFMSASGDPFDWEYFPSNTSGTQAVAGNVTERVGLIGDVVTALMPVTDDVLVFGGDHTLFEMRGDPAAGGRVDLLSDITGVAFGQAWCKDPEGTLYFFGNKPGVYRLRTGGKPERISGPIEPRLADTDTGSTIVRMVWDEPQQCVHLFLTRDDPADNEALSSTHWVFETRSQSWWPDTFTDSDVNPLCCCEYDGNNASDRAVLLGGWDGYVRKIDQDATTDDSALIDSSVWLGPIMTNELDEMLLKELQFVLGASAGLVNWSVHAGRTAEEALGSAARASGTCGAGRNNTQPVRVADHAIYVRLQSNARWAMEAVRAVFGGRGKVRRRN